MGVPDSQDELERRLRDECYFADEGLLTAIQLALALGRPLLLEGEPGVGKTEVGNVLARVLGRELIRLQCYEGLDAAQALYEWNYPGQLLEPPRRRGRGARRSATSTTSGSCSSGRCSARVRAAAGAVLLVDEIDRSDSEFEAFLLEFLGDFQITIPELGTLRAAEPPVVVAHLEPHARAARRAQAPLPLPLDSHARPRPRAGDRPCPRAPASRRRRAPSSSRP